MLLVQALVHEMASNRPTCAGRRWPCGRPGGPSPAGGRGSNTVGGREVGGWVLRSVQRKRLEAKAAPAAETALRSPAEPAKYPRIQQFTTTAPACIRMPKEPRPHPHVDMCHLVVCSCR